MNHIKALFFNNKFLLLFLSFLQLSISACGYKFAGEGRLPGDIKRIKIAMLENHTGETGAEAVLTNALIQEFNRRSNLTLTGNDDKNAFLSGKIVSARIDAVSRRDQNSAREERIHILIDLKLTDSDNNIIWSANGISANETYSVVSDNKIATEYNRREAISLISEKIAENVYYRLADMF